MKATAKNPPPVIIIDTREQHPYSFAEGVQTERRALASGDYSIVGLEHRVAVERKSLDDFVGTMTSSAKRRARFFAEMDRLHGYTHRCIVIEAGLPDILAGRFNSHATGASVFGCAVHLMAAVGVMVVFAGDRQHAREFVEKYLLACHKAIVEEAAEAAEAAEVDPCKAECEATN